MLDCKSCNPDRMLGITHKLSRLVFLYILSGNLYRLFECLSILHREGYKACKSSEFLTTLLCD